MHLSRKSEDCGDVERGVNRAVTLHRPFVGEADLQQMAIQPMFQLRSRH